MDAIANRLDEQTVDSVEETEEEGVEEDAELGDFYFSRSDRRKLSVSEVEEEDIIEEEEEEGEESGSVVERSSMEASEDITEVTVSSFISSTLLPFGSNTVNAVI